MSSSSTRSSSSFSIFPNTTSCVLTIGGGPQKPFCKTTGHKASAFHPIVIEYTIVTGVLDPLLKKIADQAKAKLHKTYKSNGQNTFSLDPRQEALDRLKSAGEGLKEQTDLRSDLSGLDADVTHQAYLKAQRHVLTFFSEFIAKKETSASTPMKNRFTFHKDQKPAEIGQWLLDMAAEVNRFLFKRMSTDEISLPEKHQKLTCFQYAMIRLKDQNAEQWALDPKGAESYMVRRFMSYEFYPVEKPQPNDLVLYFNGSSKICANDFH